MRHFDISPFYRSTIGFDRVFNLLDTMGNENNSSGYPPYNIERSGEDNYRISMAVAGFSESDLDIEIEANVLTVKGETPTRDENDETEILHQGIAARNFERRFQLADHVEVAAASLKNGLLHVDLKREVPEIMKPRAVPISTATKKIKTKQIEGEAA